MGRRVKCQVTGEYGDSETFVKINKKYYKSQAIYDVDKKQKELWSQIVSFICEDLLGYTKGATFPTLITRKLNELNYYDREVILETFKQCREDILYWISRADKFDNDIGRIHYMFAIVKGKINDVDRVWKRRAEQTSRLQNIDVDAISSFEIKNNKFQNKDISKWLEDDEK